MKLSSTPLRVHHVARLLGVPKRTVRHWAQISKIKAEKMGPRLWAFDRDYIGILRDRLADRTSSSVFNALGQRGSNKGESNG